MREQRSRRRRGTRSRGSTLGGRRRFLRATGALGIAGLAGCLGASRSGQETTTAAGLSSGADSMTAFHAGSLAPPFAEAEPAFEEEYGVTVDREAKGSVASTRKITELSRTADVLGVSDFRLLRDRLLPDYGSWYAVFATNAMVVQYREDSPGADEIGSDNWWEILSRDGVTIGHSDPAVDPGGYRAVMAMQLGKEPFEGERLYDEPTYRAIRENMTVPTGTETKLEGQLESGKLDYAVYYRSIASESGLPKVDLQPEVDLSEFSPKYAEHYATATVEAGETTYTGAPIAYGLTVPSVAEAPALGASWVEYMITDPGREVLADAGLVPKEPAVVTEGDDVPDRVAANAQAKASVGPLEL